MKYVKCPSMLMLGHNPHSRYDIVLNLTLFLMSTFGFKRSRLEAILYIKLRKIRVWVDVEITTENV